MDVDSDSDNQPYSAHHVDSGHGEDHAKHSDPAEVRLVNQCLIHNQQFQVSSKLKTYLDMRYQFSVLHLHYIRISFKFLPKGKG